MEATGPSRTARCACGHLTITTAGDPAFQAVCACRECQRRTGSAFGMSAYFDDAQIVDRQGQPTTYSRMSEKGRALDFRFCPTCGTTVWWKAAFMPGRTGIAGALFDDGAFAPSGAYFCATKPAWVLFPPEIPVAPGSRTGV